MSRPQRARRIRSRVRAGLCLVCVLGAVPCAAADQTGVATSAPTSAVPDPEVVITRRVQPRVAYRGVPLEANPVANRAAVFPRQVFHGAIDNVVGLLAADEELDARPATGLQPQLVAGTVDAATAPVHALLAGPRAAAGAATPLGGGARVGGTVSGATAGLGSIITGALTPALSTGNGP